MKYTKGFKFRDIADLTRKELLDAGIRTSTIYHTGEGYYFIDYFPANTEQDKIATHIMVQHID